VRGAPAFWSLGHANKLRESCNSRKRGRGREEYSDYPEHVYFSELL